MDRVAVVGGPGVGKSTLARRLAERTASTYIELDSLWWGPRWTPVGVEGLVDRVAGALNGTNRWIVDGNYLDEVGTNVVWVAADTLIWLDLPRAIGVRRAVWRSVRRLIHRQRLWNDNREAISTLGPRSLITLWRRWPGYSERITTTLQQPTFEDLDVIRLRSPREVRSFLAKSASR